MSLLSPDPDQRHARGLERALSRIFQGESRELAGSDALLARTIVLEEMETPGVSRRLLWLGVAAVVGFGLWATLVRFDEVAAAPGQIIPATQVQPVQHPEGGVVAAIHVQDGERVRKGALLVTLDGIEARAELQRLLAREAALKLQAERWGAFARGDAAALEAQGFDSLGEGARALLAEQRRALEAERAVLLAQIEQRSSELAGAQARAQSLEEQVKLLREDMAARQPLVEKGFMSRLAYLGFERELRRLEGEWADARSGAARARAALLESRRRESGLRQDLRTEAAEQMDKVTAELAEVQAQLRAGRSQAQRLEVRAPADGVVTGLSAVAPNQVIAPGAALAEVVPDGPLLAEVRVSPADIGYVKPGGEALVKVATYDFARFGGIEGEVRYVSAASFLDEKGQPYFKARIALDADHVGAPERGLRVSPGMTMTADIKTGSKTLAEYLFRPVSNALSESFRER